MIRVFIYIIVNISINWLFQGICGTLSQCTPVLSQCTVQAKLWINHTSSSSAVIRSYPKEKAWKGGRKPRQKVRSMIATDVGVWGFPTFYLYLQGQSYLIQYLIMFPFCLSYPFLFCIVLLFNLFIEYVWFPYSSEGNKKRENKLEGNIHQTKWQYRKYSVGEMWSKIRIENRKPKSKSELCWR